MKYFKNTEAAAIYHVSEKSVRNWVAGALAGKNGLELFQHSGRHYIANTSKNDVAIKKLVERGIRYKNTRGRKVVRPQPEFYSTYSHLQILDIFSNLDIRREIPLQYTYFDNGAVHFDLYAKRLLGERIMNTLNATDDLLNVNLEYIDYLLSNFSHINVVDLGVGNALPVKGLISHLLKKGKMGRYIGIDISEEMLRIAEANINTWFEEKVIVEKYVKDLNYDHFGYLIAQDALEDKVANIVLLIGGTLSNMRHPSRVLRLINDSMNREDIFIHSLKLDSAKARRYFNFDVQQHTRKLDRVFGTVVQLLGLDDSHYEIQQLYDEQESSRLVRIVFNFDIDLEINVYGNPRRISFKKGERVTLWRARHLKTPDVLRELEAIDFDLLNVSKTPNQEYLLSIAKVKSEIPETV